MKTYIAENVMCDWTCGLAVVKADSLEEAKELIKKELPWSDETIVEVQNALVEMKDSSVVSIFGGA